MNICLRKYKNKTNNECLFTYTRRNGGGKNNNKSERQYIEKIYTYVIMKDCLFEIKWGHGDDRKCSVT